MDKFISKYQRGFRKGYNAQYCLLAMIEKWKKQWITETYLEPF